MLCLCFVSGRLRRGHDVVGLGGNVGSVRWDPAVHPAPRPGVRPAAERGQRLPQAADAVSRQDAAHTRQPVWGVPGKAAEKHFNL